MATDVIKPVTRNYYLKLFKYVICTILGILFYVAAFVMLQCSTLFRRISEKLKTAGSTINLAGSPVKQRPSTETREEGVQTDSISDDETGEKEIETDCTNNLKTREQEIQTDYTVDSDNRENETYCSSYSDAKEEDNETYCTSYSDAKEEEADTKMDISNDKFNTVSLVCDIKIPSKQLAIQFINRTLQCNGNMQNKEDNLKSKSIQNNGKSMNSVNENIIIEEKQTFATNDTHGLQGETRPFVSEKYNYLDLSDFSEDNKLNTEYHYQGHLENHNTEPLIENLPYSFNDESNSPPGFSIAYFISEDLQIFNGVYSVFKSKIGGIGVLMDQQLVVGDVSEFVQNEQYIFYLVVNEIRTNTVLLCQLERTLNNLYNIMNKRGLKKLLISKPAITICSLELKKLIFKVFDESGIEVSISKLPQKFPIERFNVPRIKKSTKNLWEMEYQTDRIMLINLEQVHIKSWYDEVFENVNAVFPFKDKFIKDLDVRPLVPGDVLSYKIDNELLICIFIKPGSSSFYRCLENAYKQIQSELTGYRYLAFQHVQKKGFISQNCFYRCIFLLQSIFSSRNAEIWICGTYEDHEAYYLNKFNKTIDSYKNEYNVIPHDNSRFINKLEKKEIQFAQ